MWIEPKVNWQYKIVGGVYQGDHFNVVDYNRIKNNINHLKGLADKLYKEFSTPPTGTDKVVGDYLYADEINAIESSLDTINKQSIDKDYGYPASYNDNGRMIDFRELNRIEQASLDLYNNLTNQLSGKQMLSRNLGIGGMF